MNKMTSTLAVFKFLRFNGAEDGIDLNSSFNRCCVSR